MQEYVVIKKGSSINHCINLPDDFIDKDLEIQIRPLAKTEKIIDKISNLYKKYTDINPFSEIIDPVQWQRKIRDEWL